MNLNTVCTLFSIGFEGLKISLLLPIVSTGCLFAFKDVGPESSKIRLEFS